MRLRHLRLQSLDLRGLKPFPPAEGLGSAPLAFLMCSQFLVLGCGPDEASGRRDVARDGWGRLRIVVVDSILIEEHDSLYIGHPASLALDPGDGSFYVADGYAMRGYRFARSGKPLMIYGRPGDGPGEIRDTRSAFPVNDSVVAVDDFRERTLELFHKYTGDFLGRRPHGGISGGRVLASPRRDTIWMAFPDFPGGAFSVTMWLPNEDLVRPLWPVPDVYRNHPHYFAASGLTTSLARWRDRWLLGYGSLPSVYLVDLEDGYVDSLRIPVRRRRPIPENIVEIVETRPEAEKRASLSVLRYIFQRLDGYYVVVHSDPHLAGTWPSVEIWADYYVSSLSHDLEQACVDEPLPLGTRVHALFASRADTLFVLYQRILGGDVAGKPRAETWIKLLLVDLNHCAWLETTSPEPLD